MSIAHRSYDVTRTASRSVEFDPIANPARTSHFATGVWCVHSCSIAFPCDGIPSEPFCRDQMAPIKHVITCPRALLPTPDPL